MKLLSLIALTTLAVFGQTGNNCSSNTSAATGTVQSYAYCNPLVFNGRNQGGWIALNRTGDQSNSETQNYSPGNVFIQDGILTLMLRNQTTTARYYPAQSGVGSKTASFSSAFVQWNTYNFTYGDLIVRMKGPSNISNGGWPALWLLGANCEASSKVTADNTTFNGLTCNWPNGGSEEIDFFEQNPAGGSTITTTNCNLFSAGGNSLNSYTISNSSQGFHNYEVRWTVGQIQFLYDGVLQSPCTITSNVPSTPMFLQMNIAMTSAATATGLPTNMQIDWVKVCQPSPCTATNSVVQFFDDFVTPITANGSRPISTLTRFGLSNPVPGDMAVANGQIVGKGAITVK